LLARLRSNFQLNLLIQAEGYANWITMVCDFTVQTMRAWQWAPNSLFYLLSTWSSLVRGLPFMRAGSPNMVPELVPRVFKAYLLSRMDSVAVCLRDEEGAEDMLEEEEVVKQHLENLPPIARCTYSVCCEDIVAVFDPLANQLTNLIDTGSHDHGLFQLLDAQLAWLMYIMGAVTSGRIPSQNEGTVLASVIDNGAERCYSPPIIT
jgi:exportin-7